MYLVDRLTLRWLLDMLMRRSKRYKWHLTYVCVLLFTLFYKSILNTDFESTCQWWFPVLVYRTDAVYSDFNWSSYNTPASCCFNKCSWRFSLLVLLLPIKYTIMDVPQLLFCLWWLHSCSDSASE